MELDFQQITRLTVLLIFVVAGFDLGIAFLIRAVRETGNESHD